MNRSITLLPGLIYLCSLKAVAHPGHSHLETGLTALPPVTPLLLGSLLLLVGGIGLWAARRWLPQRHT